MRKQLLQIKRIGIYFLICVWFSMQLSIAQQLPNGLQMKTWQDETLYKKSYHVAQNHPSASDSNEGTLDKPFKTIGKAAEVLQAGEKVIVHSGVYKEFVQPKNGGTDAKNMISYEAAEGEKVIISGAIPIMGGWNMSLNKDGHKVSLQTWQIKLDSLLDMSKPNLFNQPNATDKQMERMNWATHLTGTAPYSLVRGMVFHNEKHLLQLSSHEDLFRLDGSYWVDTEKNMLHINPFGYVDPNEENIEITQLEQLFKPTEIATSYIKLSGFTFQKAGNGFMRVGVGAIFTNGGNHWIIENNTVHNINSVGIEIGTKFTEDREITPQERKIIDKDRGGVIVRYNEVFDCGTGGIQGHDNYDALVERNHLHHIGWQDTEFYWECAAIKLLVNRRTITQHNEIHDVVAANAIWLDWDNQNCRITGNLVHDIHPADGGALYIEASRETPNWIDHNVLWNVAKLGVSVFDSDSILVFNNLFAHTGTPFISKINTNRTMNGKPLTSNGNLLLNNIFYKNKSLPQRTDLSNAANYNLFVDENYATFKNENWGEGNEEIDLTISFENKVMTFSLPKSFPQFDTDLAVKQDMWGKSLPKEKINSGPFNTLFNGEVIFDFSDFLNCKFK